MIHHPIFIAGYPKSGTTLLTQLFNNVPDVQLDVEMHFSKFLLEMMDAAMAGGEMRTSGKDPLASRLTGLMRHSFEGYYRLCKDLYQNLHSGYSQGLRWGSNCKPIILHMAKISRMFPDATVIFLLRDPRDVWCSLKHAKWPGMEEYADMRHFLTNYRLYYQASRHPNVSTLRYHDLINQPQTAFALIGEQFQPDYLKDAGRIRQWRTLPREKVFPKEIEFADQLYTDRNQRYRTELSPAERTLIEGEFADILKAHFDDL